MKKLFVIIFSIFIFSCSDPVFWAISQEELPLDPKIKGRTTNFVRAGTSGEKMFVANNKSIYCYNEGGSWSEKSFGGISHLAATSSNLYALAGGVITQLDLNMNGSGTTITIPGKTIKSICAVGDNNIFFIGTSDSGIHYYDGSITHDVKDSSASFSMLVGVASDSTNYYLCTTTEAYPAEAAKKDGGIFKIQKSPSMGSSAELIGDSKDKEFISIIKLNSTNVVAMTRNGKLYEVSDTGITELKSFDDSRVATSALGVWTDGTNNLLLVGRQDMSYSTSSGYTHGYVEVSFDSSGAITGSFNEPGGNSGLSSMTSDTNGHYTTSIGKHAVHFICQAYDGTLFASLNKGVWSYRNRSDKYTWNAED